MMALGRSPDIIGTKLFQNLSAFCLAEEVV